MRRGWLNAIEPKEINYYHEAVCVYELAPKNG